MGVSNPLAISPSRESPWHFGSGDFVGALLRRWPEAEIRLMDADDDFVALDFTVPLGGEHPILCSLTADGRGVWVRRSTVVQGAVVAAWVRGLVPPEQELVFYDQGYSFDVPLTPGITPEEIEAAVAAFDER
jgi:hypothetical protein